MRKGRECNRDRGREGYRWGAPPLAIQKIVQWRSAHPSGNCLRIYQFLIYHEGGKEKVAERTGGESKLKGKAKVF